MSSCPNSLVLAALLALGGSASAEFTRIPAFAGTDFEGFETQDLSGAVTACIADGVFGGRAELCTLDGSADAHIVLAWYYSCAMQEHGGTRFFGSGGPAVALHFDAPVSRFGGYFGTNNPIASGGVIRFLDANGVELHSDVIGAVNNCSWNWNGWDGGGAAITTIEISSNYGNGGYLMLDDLEADISPDSTGTAYCYCDGSTNIGPCGNDGAEGRGCGNSAHTDGARLSADGWARIGSDSLTLHAEGLVPGHSAIFFQGVSPIGAGLGVYFGDGVRCVAGRIVRLETVPVVEGAGVVHSTVPLSTAGGAAVAAGETRYYQLWYRDTSTSPCNSAFNLTNAVEVTWEM